jgi:hypothetical protein
MVEQQNLHHKPGVKRRRSNLGPTISFGGKPKDLPLASTSQRFYHLQQHHCGDQAFNTQTFEGHSTFKL